MARPPKGSQVKKTDRPVKNTAVKAKTVNVKRVSVGAESRRPFYTGFGDQLNPGRLLAELLGVFVLTLAVIAALSGKFALTFFTTPEVATQAAGAGQAIPSFGLYPFVAAFALVTIVLATYKISGGQLNPAVTIGQMALRRQHWSEGIGYIVAQILGAMLALSVASQLLKVLDASTGKLAPIDPSSLFNRAASWELFAAEVLGAFVFGFAVAAAFTYRDLPRAVVYGGAFLIGIAVASMAGAGVLNPALAVGIGLVGMGGANALALAGIYLGGSVLGVLIGMAFHKLLSRDAVETIV